jgi:hypothetical protein
MTSVRLSFFGFCRKSFSEKIELFSFKYLEKLEKSLKNTPEDFAADQEIDSLNFPIC